MTEACERDQDGGCCPTFRRTGSPLSGSSPACGTTATGGGSRRTSGRGAGTDPAGYRLGIIANTITETEIPDWLEADGLTGYFEVVVLSSKTGLRKPGPEIYLEAARRMGVEPARSVYVGDNPSRDILGARLAGYGRAIILMEPAWLAKEPPTEDHKPDHVIHEMSDLLDLFPARSAGAAEAAGTRRTDAG